MTKSKEKKALVIQGGALRSVFTAGVLDAFLVSKYNPFDLYIAVSSGAMCLAYYLSEQYKEVHDIMLELSEDSEFMSAYNALSEEGYMNLSYLKEYSQKTHPLHIAKAMGAVEAKKSYFVATNLESGEPVYLQPNHENYLKCLLATSTLPFVTKGKREIDGVQLMDGGWSDPIPAKTAVDMGATELVMIRTVPIDYKLEWSYLGWAASYWHASNEGMSKRFANEESYYNESVDYLLENPDGVNIVQIAPDQHLSSGGYVNQKEHLIRDYRNGLEKGLDYLRKYT